MKRLSKSAKILAGLVLTLALISVINSYLPQPDYLPAQDTITKIPKTLAHLLNVGMAFILYGCLGYLGLLLSRKTGFPEFWDSQFTLKQKLLTPALVGIALGVFIIVFEIVFGRFHDLGPLPHPTFPSSILATMGAAIGEEILFRLFFIPFFIWLISHILLKNKWQTQIFWIVTFFSAIVFSLIHIPTVMIVYGLESINQIPDALMIGILVVNSVVSFFAAWYFKKYGFITAVGIHFWTNIVWHVIWGAV